MAVLALHPDAKADLDGMIPSDAALIAVCLQEVESDPKLVARLLDDHFGEDATGHYGVKKWARLWNGGLDIWRLRLWKAECSGVNYRIFYAYLQTQQRFYILGIVPRDEVDYDDPNSQLEVRIRAAFDSL
jgi:mRNA-degrading endonuclease RelE of RelBE toxin-antitoxin system